MQILFWLHFVMVMALQTYIKQKTDLISNFLKSELIKAVIQNLNQESFLIRTLTPRTAMYCIYILVLLKLTCKKERKDIVNFYRNVA